MSGLLLHGKDFRADHYRASNGTSHYEIQPVDGDFFSMPFTAWNEIMSLCSESGIPMENWPVYETSIDVPLEELRTKNSLLREQLLTLPEAVVQSLPCLEKIVDQVRHGSMIVYCRLY